jgi:hypothetical protein
MLQTLEKTLDYKVAGAEPGRDKVKIESYLRDIFSMGSTFYFQAR